MTITEAKKAYIEALTAQPGVNPTFKRIGCDYATGSVAFDELVAEDKIEWRKVPSATGRMMSRPFVK